MKLGAQLPPDVRVMNAVSALLYAVVALVALGLALRWAARLPVFAVRAIQIEGDVDRNSEASLRANVLPRLSGSFLSLDLQGARAAFEAVPWVRRASLQRVWPMQLRVEIEEHRAAASWEPPVDGAEADAQNEQALVNSFGEVFQANLAEVEDEHLPVFAGPSGSAAAMLRMWRGLQPLRGAALGPMERLDLSGRGSWRLGLQGGVVIELGRGSEAEVLERFAHFAATVGEISSRLHAPLISADLRHTDGYAIRLRGVSIQSPGKPVNQKP